MSILNSSFSALRNTVVLGLTITLVLGIHSCAEAPQTAEAQSEADLDSLLRKGIRDSRELKFEEAHATLSRLLTAAETSENVKYRVLGNLNMGAMYVYLNAHDEALNYFFRSLDIAESENRTEWLNSIYNNIGIIYSDNDAEETAEEYFRKALAISRERKEMSREGMNLINLGITLEKLGRDEESISCFHRAASIFVQLGDSINVGAAYNGLGTTHFKSGEYSTALSMFRRAFESSSPENQPWFRWEYGLNIGRVYNELGAYDSARTYLSEARAGFASTDNHSMLAKTAEALAQTEKKAGNPSVAAIHFDEALALKDSLLEKKTSKWVSELQMNYTLGKKEQELAMMHQMAEKRRLLWTGTAIAAAFIAVLLFLNMRTGLKNLKQKNLILKQRQEVDRLTIERNRARSQALEKQMEAEAKLHAVNRQKMQQEIEFRDRELAGKAMHLVSKNDVLSKIRAHLAEWEQKKGPERNEHIRQMRSLVKSADGQDRDWQTFKMHFEEVHPHFFSDLSSTYPELTSADLRMLSYLMLNLSGKEMARILNITPEAVRKRKQRLRQKLNLAPDIDLSRWLRTH